MYPVLVKQMTVDLITNIMWLVISIAVIGICVKLFMWAFKKDSSDDNYTDYDDHMVLYIITGIIAIVSLIIAIVCIQSIVQIKLNPNYYIFTNYIQPLLPGNN